MLTNRLQGIHPAGGLLRGGWMPRFRTAPVMIERATVGLCWISESRAGLANREGFIAQIQLLPGLSKGLLTASATSGRTLAVQRPLVQTQTSIGID